MISISLDTTNNVYIAILKDNIVLSSTTHKRGEINLADNIVYIIDSLINKLGIKLSEVSYLSVLNGPGYFTGIRISVVVGKIMQQALNITCITVSAFECLYNEALNYIKNNNSFNSVEYIISTVDIGKTGAVIEIKDINNNTVLEPQYIEDKEEINNLIVKYKNHVVVGNKQDIFNSNNIKDIFDININVLHNISYTKYKENSTLQQVEAFYVKNADIIVKNFTN